MSKEDNTFTNFSDALADAVEKAAGAVVLVDGRRRFPASGVLYADDLVLTADHVLERDEEINVILADGKEINATVAGRDPSSDLALLKLSEAVEGAPEPFQGEMRVGELVLALGRHSTKGIEASLGVVSYINGPVRTHRGGMIERFIRTDAAPLPGFSGGALWAASFSRHTGAHKQAQRGRGESVVSSLSWTSSIPLLRLDMTA